MSSPYTIAAQFVMSLFSLVFNAFGIYCLRKHRNGNKSQCMLLQNLAVVEITKTLYDYLPLALFYFQKDWYAKHFFYFEIIEVDIMTILFCSYALITLDRLLCVSLKTKYKTVVTAKLVRNVLIGSWAVSLIPGFVGWLIWSRLQKIKWYYYISVDMLLSVLICTTYVFIITILRRRKRKLSESAMKNAQSTKFPTVPFLLMLSFLIFNVVPDMVFMFHRDYITYHVVSFLWTTGYFIDPLVYIFPGKKIRRIATSFVAKKVRWTESVRHFTDQITKRFTSRTQKQNSVKELNSPQLSSSDKRATLLIHSKNGHTHSCRV